MHDVPFDGMHPLLHIAHFVVFGFDRLVSTCWWNSMSDAILECVLKEL